MKRKFKAMIDGLLIALQFFTIIPVKKQVKLDPVRLKKAMQIFPLIGLVFGVFFSCIIAFGQAFTAIPTTVLALFVLTVSISFSGGIHLDGWMDTSDAFFSFRDKEKRLQIMDDPRVGSFAVLSLFFLLAWRYVFIVDTIPEATMTTFILMALIPCYARLVMVIVFLFSPLAKEEGLAAYFKAGVEKKDIIFHAGSIIVIFIGIYFFYPNALVDVIYFLIVSLLFVILSKRFIERQFGGITGDTLGATVEGAETGLWLMLWLLH